MQAFKMAWKSIWGKKGRSALTMLGIIIGIAAVMTIVSVLGGHERVYPPAIRGHGQQPHQRLYLVLFL
ncbi:MAG: ABC transporter permease [Oscillospiraceae bacterium]